jgi:hypothetical protein
MAALTDRDVTDLRGPGGTGQLIRELRQDGLAVFSGVADRADLREVAARLLTAYSHPDSGPDGVTVITGSGDEHGRGLAAFTRAELQPHTDRSTVPEPPLLVMIVCAGPADRGGESLVVDGKLLHDVLAAEDEQTLQILSRPRSALFGGAGGYLGAIFESTAEGRVAVRMRMDELGQFSPDVTRVIPRLVTLAEQHMLTLPLHAGQGYVLNNSRWLHGRTRFSGKRTILRVLGDPLPHLAVRRGFAPTGSEQECRPRAAADGQRSKLIATCAGLTDDFGDRYHVRADGSDPCRAVRYVATARRLETHPYAVITADPAELRRALRPGEAPAPLTSCKGD